VRNLRKTIPTAAVLVALALAGVPAGATTTPAPSVRLVQTSHRATVITHLWGDTTWTETNFGLYVEARGARLDIRVKRTWSNLPITATATLGDRTRTIPSWLLDGWNGLRNAFEITWRTPSGELISQAKQDWCPNRGSESRLSPGASETTAFSWTCGTHPFTRGMRWGVDRDWARRLFDFETIEVPSGYTGTEAKVDVVLRPELAKIFGIPETDRSHSFDVTLEVDDQSTQPTEQPMTARSFARQSGNDVAVPSAASDSRRTVPRTTTGFVPPNSTLPDLIALPAYGISTHNEDGHDLLAFGATVYNGGHGPLAVEGFRRGSQELMDAYQSFYTAHGTTSVGATRVGSMEYDAREGHQHWHFKDFALYDLVDKDGTPLLTSGKEAFCLAPTDPINLLLRSAAVNAGNGDLETACGDESSIWVREVLAAGWGGTYNQERPGQAIDITDLPNGTYWVRVTANPAGRLKELTKTNNKALRKVILGGTPGDRTVEVPAYNLIDSEQ